MSKSSGQVTIKSIAEALGISFSTVSKALNGDPTISEQTRQLVVAKAEEMHYTRNYFAQSLRQKSSKNVAVITNDVDIPAYGTMIASISNTLAAYGYTTTTSDCRYNQDIEYTNIRNILARSPEAVIVALSYPQSQNMKLFEPILQHTLFLGDMQGFDGINSVTLDHHLAGRLSAEHMLKHGNLRNLVFCGPADYLACQQYMNGIREAYAQFGQPLDMDMVQHFIPEQKTSYHRFLRAWQEMDGQIDGVICFCDSMALGIYQAARELGLQMGQDISVIGYDDGPFNDYLDPPMTSIHMPKDQVAAYCTDFVIKRLLNGDTRPFRHVLQPHLADRDSVRKIPEAAK